MTISLKFYADAGLTSELTGLSFTRADDGSSAADSRVVYLGSTASGKTFTAQDGTSPVKVQIVDSNTGAGVPASAVKLALSSGGLDSATGGAELSVAASVQSGTANAKAIHIRVETGALAIGNYSDLSLTTNALAEA